MKMHALLFAALAGLSTTAATAGTIANPTPVRLAEMVTYIEATYGGEVTAIEFDAAGDKGPHYHVGLWYPKAGPAQMDIDAVSRRIVVHDTGDLPVGSMTLADAVTLASTHVPGRLTIAQLDAADGTRPHYDVDVRLNSGKIARLKIDAATREIGWRQPPVVDE